MTALGIDIVEEFLKFQRGNKSDADVSTEKDLLVQFNELTTLEKERMLNTNEKLGMNTLQRLKFGFGIKGYVIEHIAKTQTKGVAPANEHYWKQNVCCLAMNITEAPRSEKTARWNADT